MTFTLRPATVEDLMAVGDLHHRSRSAAYRGIVPDEALSADSGELLGRWWTERWTYERDTHLMTVAEDDGRLVGFSYVGPEGVDVPEVPGPHVGELYAIHLDPAEQGRGLGRALMVDALAGLRRQGWSEAVLWVLADNTHARRFYERGGWATDGAERVGDIGPATTRQLRYRRSLD